MNDYSIKPIPTVRIGPPLAAKLSFHKVHLLPAKSSLFKVEDGSIWDVLDGNHICRVRDTSNFPREKGFDGWVFKSVKERNRVIITPVANDTGFFSIITNNPMGKGFYMLSESSVLRYPDASTGPILIGLKKAAQSGMPFLIFLDQLTYCPGVSHESL